ncbi:MAG: helix-turn-helix transcriptional regulator [Dysgonomonas sp.]|nr:helix-turn-helix transcriptional regulator [Dysgonomonas sp.]
MKANEEHATHLGKNIKHLMRALQITQTQLAEKLGMPDSHVCNLLQKLDIDDNTLQRLAEAMGYGVSAEMIKNYNHEDTIKYIFNNYHNTIESGGTNNGSFQDDKSSTYQEGSQPTINNYVAEQAFESMREIADLKSEIMRLRMKYEPDAVENELKNKK